MVTRALTKKAATHRAATREVDVLIAVRLKGRAMSAAIEDAVGDDAVEVLDALVTRGLIEQVKAFFKVTPAGAEAVADALADIRFAIGEATVAAGYEDFCAINGDFKVTVTDWQLRTVDGAPTVNSHTDRAYDASVLDRLRAIHAEISAVLDAFPPAFPRYARYIERLDRALEKLSAGQLPFMASPAVDSYHSVWFELHEELIMLCGLTRAGEAEAGRG